MSLILGTEWMPVLEQDRESQRRDTREQPPYSDAYLSGMPSRKRRCLRQARPPLTLDQLIDGKHLLLTSWTLAARATLQRR